MSESGGLVDSSILVTPWSDGHGLFLFLIFVTIRLAENDQSVGQAAATASVDMVHDCCR